VLSLSIRQNPEDKTATPVPDFRSVGTLARIVIAVNALALIVAAARASEWSRLAIEFIDLAAVVEPPLVFVMLLLFSLQPWLRLLSWPALAAAAFVLSTTGAGALALLLEARQREILLPGGVSRAMAWSVLAAALVLYYLYLRGKAFSPALSQARLMALTARIRPHFLFNSLNAVLGIMRSEPRRAESALEELAELFRALMRENRQLTALADEIALCRQYLDLEQLRLGERLRVAWRLDGCPDDALVPPLMLQPLLENAVYHGIEPASTPDPIAIHITRQGDTVFMELTNPYHESESHHAGNRMALDNIRERLALFFDMEAQLNTVLLDGRFRVTIRLPYRRASS